MGGNEAGENQKKGPNYSPSDVQCLALAWLQVSTDATVGVNQSGDTFWNKVTKVFNKMDKVKTAR